MSLLMDALKKAEMEKKKAAAENSDNDDALLESTQSIDEFLSTDTIETKAEESDKAESDNSWAFSTDELQLEPLQNQQDQEESSEVENASSSSSLLKDDTTLVDVSSNTNNDVLADKFDEDITLRTDPDLVASDFDHDATLPSERAIQSSLKDYFDASQSITMDQKSVADAASTTGTDFTETSVQRNRPLDTSATHVTAHTIFTAGQTRKASTGLAKYALFGSFFLALGLGAVALYYSAMTPSTVDAPVSLPSVAKIVESENQPGSVEVDVNTASVSPPFEPKMTASDDLSDPVITEVVKEVAMFDAEKSQQEVVSQEAGALTESAIINATTTVEEKPASVETATTEIQEKVALTPETTTEPQGIEELNVVESSEFESLENGVVHYPEAASTVAIEEPTQSASSLTASLNQSDQPYISDEPINAIPAEAFAENLSLPKSAIKITRSGSKLQFNNNLLTAYNAYQQGDYIAAKNIYRQILSRKPDNRDAHLGLAAIDVVEGNPESAYQHYVHLLQRNPQDPVVNAALFSLQGQSSGNISESHLKLMLDRDPNSAQVHFSLGSFYAKQQRWPEAQKSFFEAFGVDKTNPDYAYNLAVSLDQMEQTKAALDYYRQALKLADQHHVSFNTSQVLARIQKLSGIANR